MRVNRWRFPWVGRVLDRARPDVRTYRPADRQRWLIVGWLVGFLGYGLGTWLSAFWAVNPLVFAVAGLALLAVGMAVSDRLAARAYAAWTHIPAGYYETWGGSSMAVDYDEAGVLTIGIVLEDKGCAQCVADDYPGRTDEGWWLFWECSTHGLQRERWHRKTEVGGNE